MSTIDINALPELTMAKVPTYQEILRSNETELKKHNPKYIRQAGADDTMMLEAYSYRELALRSQVADWAKNLFWMTAVGDALDHHAGNVGLQRSAGAKPTAEYTFKLSSALSYDVTIPTGCVLGDEGGKKRAEVLNAIVITAGTTEKDGIVELQEFTQTSSVKTPVILTALAFVVEAKAKADFSNGASRESDEALRRRIDLSFTDKSTAGAMRTYTSYAFRADDRIKDVNVLNDGTGRVKVVYYAETMDAVMKNRLTAALNAYEVRPLSDVVTVVPASVQNFTIRARLVVKNSQDATIKQRAEKNLTDTLKKKRTIENKVYLSDIIALLKIEGIEDVQVSQPTTSVLANATQVAVANSITITEQRI